MYVLVWRTVYALTRGLFWCLFPEFRGNEGNKHQNNTRVSAYTVRHKSTHYFISYTTWRNHKWRSKRGYSHIIPVSHSLALRYVDDVTIDRRWRNNDQTIVTRTRDNWYLTRYMSILFTAIFTAGRVRKSGCIVTCASISHKSMKLSLSVVRLPPGDISFPVAPTLQSPTLGTDAIIACQADGLPEPEVTWRRQGTGRIEDGRSASDQS